MTVQPPVEQAVLALDVGGTTIVGGIVLADGSVAEDVRRVASPEEQDAATVIRCLTGVLADLRRSTEASGIEPVGVGIAMPGPFDYERGISWMRHKLPAIHGVELMRPLERATRLPVRFCNDAIAFALGAWWRKHSGQRRLAAITIGTGLGAGFVVDGRPVGEEEGAPPGGVVWDVPWRDGVLEDYVSGGGVEAGYVRRGGESLGADDIAARARNGDPLAAAAFADLGATLGEGLARTIAGFRATCVVCGGQVAKAFDLFGDRAEAVYAGATGTEVAFCAETGAALSLAGAARHAAAAVR